MLLHQRKRRGPRQEARGLREEPTGTPVPWPAHHPSGGSAPGSLDDAAVMVSTGCVRTRKKNGASTGDALASPPPRGTTPGPKGTATSLNAAGVVVVTLGRNNKQMELQENKMELQENQIRTLEKQLEESKSDHLQEREVAESRLDEKIQEIQERVATESVLRHEVARLEKLNQNLEQQLQEREKEKEKARKPQLFEGLKEVSNSDRRELELFPPEPKPAWAGRLADALSKPAGPTRPGREEPGQAVPFSAFAVSSTSSSCTPPSSGVIRGADSHPAGRRQAAKAKLKAKAMAKSLNFEEPDFPAQSEPEELDLFTFSEFLDATGMPTAAFWRSGTGSGRK